MLYRGAAWIGQNRFSKIPDLASLYTLKSGQECTGAMGLSLGEFQLGEKTPSSAL
jgi:hypothetical protein